MITRSTAFICGCGHTGTSLLANMFAAHPRVFVPLRETETFICEAKASAQLDALMAEAASSGKPHLIEKTPRHVHRLNLIRAMVPSARFVLTMRDGRAVAASFIKRYGSARPGIERWISDSTVVLQAMASADVILLRYEDLICHPATELERICRFLSIPYDAGMLQYHLTQRLWFGVTEMRKASGEAGLEHRVLRNWQSNQPLFDEREQWRGQLPDSDREILEEGAGRELMTAFGYIHSEAHPNRALASTDGLLS